MQAEGGGGLLYVFSTSKSVRLSLLLLVKEVKNLRKKRIMGAPAPFDYQLQYLSSLCSKVVTLKNVID